MPYAVEVAGDTHNHMYLRKTVHDIFCNDDLLNVIPFKTGGTDSGTNLKFSFFVEKDDFIAQGRDFGAEYEHRDIEKFEVTLELDIVGEGVTLDRAKIRGITEDGKSVLIGREMTLKSRAVRRGIIRKILAGGSPNTNGDKKFKGIFEHCADASVKTTHVGSADISGVLTDEKCLQFLADVNTTKNLATTDLEFIIGPRSFMGTIETIYSNLNRPTTPIDINGRKYTKFGQYVYLPVEDNIYPEFYTTTSGVKTLKLAFAHFSELDGTCLVIPKDGQLLDVVTPDIKAEGKTQIPGLIESVFALAPEVPRSLCVLDGIIIQKPAGE